MKTLKFRPKLAEKILNNTKTTTWRLFDDKDLQVGDEVSFVYTETGEEFAKVKIKKFKDLIEEDWQGHEKYNSEEEMYYIYSQYYNQPVTRETEIKMIDFEILDKS